MNSAKRVVIGGAGAGGLAAGWGLASQGYDVVILEKLSAHCQVQSGSNGGQARRHGGAFYAGLPQIARQVHSEAAALYDIPNAVRHVGAIYFVRKRDRALVVSGWQEAGVPYHENPQMTTLLDAEFVNRMDVTAFITSDHVINTQTLADVLHSKFMSANGQLELGTAVVGSDIKQGKITQIRARTQQGDERLFPCDIWINVTGAWQQEVERLVNPDAKHIFPDSFGWTATPTLRCTWDWQARRLRPTILQFYGDFASQFLNQMSIIPIVDSAAPTGAKVAISTAEENSVGHPDDFYDASRPLFDANQAVLQNKLQNLECLLTTALNGPNLSGFLPGDMSWCVKSFLIDPEVRNRGIGWGALFVTVFSMHEHFGGAENSLIAAPGKLGSVLEFKDRVVQKVIERFGKPLASARRAARLVSRP